MSVSIREYAEGDRSAVVLCVRQLQDFVASMDLYQRIRRDEDFDADDYLDKTLQKVGQKNGIVYVAVESGLVIGCIVGVIQLPQMDNPEGYPTTDGIVLELVVLSGHKRKRVGTMLMEKMEAYFAAQHCSVIKVDCFAPNKDAHAFYKKLGYEDRIMTMIKKSV